MEQKISMNDIRGIKPGTSVTFTPSNRKLFQSIRNMASIIGKQEPELGCRYSCSVNYEKCQITIKAIPNKFKK